MQIILKKNAEFNENGEKTRHFNDLCELLSARWNRIVSISRIVAATFDNRTV